MWAGAPIFLGNLSKLLYGTVTFSGAAFWDSYLKMLSEIPVFQYVFINCSSSIGQVDCQINRSEKLRQMVRQGIPHSMRPQLWMRLSGALEKKKNSDLTYKDIVKTSSNDHLMTSKQIEKVICYLLL